MSDLSSAVCSSALSGFRASSQTSELIELVMVSCAAIIRKFIWSCSPRCRQSLEKVRLDHRRRASSKQDWFDRRHSNRRRDNSVSELQIGRASWRERVGQHGEYQEVAVR